LIGVEEHDALRDVDVKNERHARDLSVVVFHGALGGIGAYLVLASATRAACAVPSNTRLKLTASTLRVTILLGEVDVGSLCFLYSLPPRPVTAVVRVDPFFAKIIASSCAGSVWLGLPDSSWTAPGGSKNISPTL